MAGQIRMTPDEARQKATQYRNEGNNLEQMIATLQRLTDSLMTEWEGQAAVKFNDQFTELKPSLNTMRTNIATVADQLDGAANGLEQLDQDIASGFGVR